MKVNTFHKEGVIREKTNYILYESVVGTTKEKTKPKSRSVEKPKPKPQPKPQPKPKIRAPQPQPKMVKKTEIVDNIDYLETKNNRKVDEKRKSITIYTRRSDPFVKETYEVEYPAPKKPANTVKPAPKQPSYGDNYQYYESKNITKEKERQPTVIHKRRNVGEF